MERYWLFGGDIYYASGGMADFVGQYAVLAEAVAAWQAEYDYTWWHVVDTQSMMVVAGSPGQGYGAGDLTVPRALPWAE